MTDQPDHIYLSTGCLHGQHGYCKAMTGMQGAKRPARCKFCDAACQCPCHPSEETAGQPEVATQATDTPATITDLAYLREQYADAVQPLIMDVLPKPIAAARAWEIADAILFVRDRHLQQLRQRLQLADSLHQKHGE